MTTQVAMLLAILAAMSVSFFAELLPISFTALMVPVLLQATGILKPAEAWAGFSNTTIITWYGLFVIGGAFTKTSFTKKIRDFVNRNAKGSSLRVTLIVLIACSVIGIMTSAGGTIALLSPLLLEICKDTGMDPKKLFKPTADVCNWASVQMLPVGGSIAYLMWFNSYLEQVGTDLRYGLFDFTFIKFPMWLILVAYYLFMSRGQKLKDASIAAVAEDDKPSRYTPEQEKVIVGIFFLNVILMVIASMTKIIAPYLVSLFFAAIIVGRGSSPGDSDQLLRHERLDRQPGAGSLPVHDQPGGARDSIRGPLHGRDPVHEQPGCLGSLRTHRSFHGSFHGHGSPSGPGRRQRRLHHLLRHPDGCTRTCVCLFCCRVHHEGIYQNGLVPLRSHDDRLRPLGSAGTQLAVLIQSGDPSPSS